jgi:phosphatidylethanolamine-binding protein
MIIEAQVLPQLSLSSGLGTYIVVGLDIDAPFPSFTALSPLLHWLQPGLKAESPINNKCQLESSGTIPIVNYLGPFPPPGSGPHRYLFLLYEQPVTFDTKTFLPANEGNSSVWQRARYSLEAFEKEAKLGSIVAANYFTSH